eukprot:1152669-Pelagomonas_calceolata.AAC.4
MGREPLGLPAKQTSSASPVLSGGQMGPWTKCSGMSVEWVWAEDGQRGSPSPPPALTLGVQSKQAYLSGNL